MGGVASPAAHSRASREPRPSDSSAAYSDGGRLIDQGPYADLLERQPGLRALAAQDWQAESG